MKLFNIINQSSIPDRDIEEVIPYLQTQINTDFFPIWYKHAKLLFADSKSTTPHDYFLILKDINRNQYSNYQYLQVTPEDYSLVMSKEILNQLVNPYRNLYVDLPMRNGDPCYTYVQVTDEYCGYYDIHHIKVSNFLLPESFENNNKQYYKEIK